MGAADGGDVAGVAGGEEPVADCRADCAAGVGAFVSVPAAAAGFALLFAVGGTAPIALSTLLSAMVGVHLAIGVGEAVITALVVGSVLAVRPDLVHGARGLLPTRTLVSHAEAVS